MIVCIVLLALGCSNTELVRNEPKLQIRTDFKQLLDSLAIQGTVIVFDSATNVLEVGDTSYLNKGFLPASTFKIPNTLIGLELGVITKDHIFLWDSTPRRNPNWNQDLPLPIAFRASCVPCYQELARNIGQTRMRQMLDTLGYPGMTFSDASIDMFWLQGASAITPMQQLNFLRRLHDRTLPLKPSTYDDFALIFPISNDSLGTFSGKTGTTLRDASMRGWFVGWLQLATNVRYVVVLIEPPSSMTMEQAVEVRMAIARKVLLKK
ncbi:MAG: class D beta-lactamase [Candidatus Kapabacteria bacterium]|nr:class D beta-lactamase [Ignavibacteria bacterium]MBK7577755.1 class D beta-lactamase [Ignavibacteria bacterium]MBK9183663.1 class D beta-lactamase [Ignavibacteria bacterium]MBP6509862.1 class D beta-lactamase [Candidatus Kapabacteria bacterium]MBP7094382.1 class D beta-lactamase [Candidatus Kapabacteria bacterium]